MKRFLRVAVVLALASCSNAGELADGVIEIQVIPPQPSIIDFGDTTRFVAVPLNQEGDSVGAPVVWVTPDDSSLTIIDASTGLVTGTKPNTLGRMQAVLGTLTTGFYPLAIRARADTIVFPDDTLLTVESDASSSAPLLPVLQSFNPAGPVTAQNLVFTIVKPAYADTTGQQAVEFSNKLLVQTVLTAADGTPVTEVTVSKVAGRTAPDSVLVSVTATQASGNPVPGSGQLFLVLFE